MLQEVKGRVKVSQLPERGCGITQIGAACSAWL